MRHDGTTDAEADGIFLAFREQHSTSQSPEGSWSDLFRGTHLPRTVIASALFWFQQTAGGQFVNSYAPSFLVDQMRLGPSAFTWTLATQVAGFFAAAAVLFVVDTYGRRPVLLSGLALVVLANLAIAAFGSLPSQPVVGVVVAALMLLGVSMKFSASTLAYLVAAEIGGVRMRKKTMGFATAVDVVSASVVTFALPYLLGGPAHLGAGVCWIMGADAAAGLAFSYLFVPELKGVSLEEVDDLFDGKPTLWGSRQTGEFFLFFSVFSLFSSLSLLSLL